jgi:hypothetical protein
MAVTSLRTQYGDILFRSRLEARWAVWMDEVGIKWEYEPVWLETRYGNWLPDFRLEDGRWAEVKGVLSPREHERLITLASLVGGHEGRDVVLLGHMPKKRSIRWPVQLHRCHNGELWVSEFTRTPRCPVESDAMRKASFEVSPEALLAGGPFGRPRWSYGPGMQYGFDAIDWARRVRFTPSGELC